MPPPTRLPISAGNWKMQATNAEADALCEALEGIERIAGVEVVLAPSYLQLARVAVRFQGRGIGIAGQNMHFEEKGAFTGEVSPAQLAEVADWVILGHSERRQHFCESDAALQRKVKGGAGAWAPADPLCGRAAGRAAGGADGSGAAPSTDGRA